MDSLIDPAFLAILNMDVSTQQINKEGKVEKRKAFFPTVIHQDFLNKIVEQIWETYKKENSNLENLNSLGRGLRKLRPINEIERESYKKAIWDSDNKKEVSLETLNTIGKVLKKLKSLSEIEKMYCNRLGIPAGVGRFDSLIDQLIDRIDKGFKKKKLPPLISDPLEELVNSVLNPSDENTEKLSDTTTGDQEIAIPMEAQASRISSDKYKGINFAHDEEWEHLSPHEAIVGAGLQYFEMQLELLSLKRKFDHFGFKVRTERDELGSCYKLARELWEIKQSNPSQIDEFFKNNTIPSEDHTTEYNEEEAGLKLAKDTALPSPREESEEDEEEIRDKIDIIIDGIVEIQRMINHFNNIIPVMDGIRSYLEKK